MWPCSLLYALPLLGICPGYSVFGGLPPLTSAQNSPRYPLAFPILKLHFFFTHCIFGRKKKLWKPFLCCPLDRAPRRWHPGLTGIGLLKPTALLRSGKLNHSGQPSQRITSAPLLLSCYQKWGWRKYFFSQKSAILPLEAGLLSSGMSEFQESTIGVTVFI